MIYNSKKRFSATSSFYYGYQQKSGASAAAWWQANLIGSYSFNEVISLSGRIEYFNDAQGAIIETSINGLTGFRSASTGACVNFKWHQFVLLRFEARKLLSKDNVYQDENNNPKNNEGLLIGSLTAWF